MPVFINPVNVKSPASVDAALYPFPASNKADSVFVYNTYEAVALSNGPNKNNVFVELLNMLGFDALKSIKDSAKRW